MDDLASMYTSMDDPSGHIDGTVEQVLMLQRQMEKTLADLVKGQSATQDAIAELSKSFGRTPPAACLLEPETTQQVNRVRVSDGVLSPEPAACNEMTVQNMVSLAPTIRRTRSLSAPFSFQRIKIAPGIEKTYTIDQDEAEDKLDQLMGEGNYKALLNESLRRSPSMLQEFGHRKFMLDPHGRPRILHDLISIAMLGFDALSAPVVLAWDVSIGGFLYMFNLLSVGFWVLDISLGFITGFHVQGEVETRPSVVARRYMTTWFLPDFCIILADVVALSMGGLTDQSRETGSSGLRASKVGRFLRLIRLCRLARVGRAFARLTDASTHLETFVDIMKPLFVLVMVNHILACAWWSMSRWISSDTGLAWVNEPVSASTGETYIEMGFVFQYLTCMHWSLTQQTPGSMEIVPRNSYERAFNCFCLLLGMLLFSSLISTISAKMMQHNMKQKDNLAKLVALRRFLTTRVHPSLAYAAQFKASRAMSPNTGKPTTIHEVSAIAMLPQALQRSIRVDLCEKHLKHPLFRWWLVLDSKGAQNLCYEAIDFVGLAADDHLFFPRTDATGAYIMIRGAAVYIPELDRGEKLQVAHGQFFCEAALWCKWKHIGELTATVGCELISISSTGLIKCLDQDAIVKHVVTEYGRIFYARLTAAQVVDEDQSNDISVASTKFASILPLLPLMCRQLVGAVALKVARKAKGRRTIPASAADVRQGRCCIMVNWEGEIERIISTSALSLSRQDGKVLMQIGVRNAERIVASCQLPGNPLQDGETETQAFDRMLHGICASLAESIAPTHVEMQVWKGTRQMPERTRHFRVVHHAVLTCPSESLGLEAVRVNTSHQSWDSRVSKTLSPRFQRKSSVSSLEFSGTQSWLSGIATPSPSIMEVLPDFDTSIYALADTAGDIVLVGWLSPEEQSAFTSQQGETRLQRMIDKLTLEAGILEAAKARRASTQGVECFERSCV